MTVNLLIDMNLSPDWVPVLNDRGWNKAGTEGGTVARVAGTVTVGR